MKIKIFDVVELNDGTKATILESNSNNNFKVNVVDDNGKLPGNTCIKIKDIRRILFTK